MNESITWLKSIIRDKLDWIGRVHDTNNGVLSPDEFLTLWVYWLMQHDFVKIFGKNEGYIIARPVRLGWVFDTDIDYFETLFLFDRDGDVAWIDSLWAPGRYADVLTFLQSTTKPYVAWSHGHKLYFKVIKELSGSQPLKSEIGDAFTGRIV